MRALFLLGRLIFGGFFVFNGINHFRNQEGMSQYAAAKGVPAADTAIPVSGALLLAGGLSVMAGLKPRQGLAALLGFLVPVTLTMHRFWEVEEPQQRMNEMINFSKNLALIGATMMMLQIEHPWQASVDQARSADEEMFVRLGSRELRSLPA
jgi:putative oxidoreductase